MVVLENRLPEPQDYNELSWSVGWGTEPDGVVRAALRGTLFAICAFESGRLVGHARLIGDGALFVYVQDVMVHPDWQGKGVGTQLMERIVEQIDALKQRSPSLRAYLGASAGRESFYERFGFVTRRSAGLGAGMVRF